ncbi:MAG: hypothetical protein JKX71_12335 [Amylibacter sp.]|nr:hypothetical protein [Amylibacter sp.]
MPFKTHKMLLALSVGIVGIMLTANSALAIPANCAQRAEMVEKLKIRFGESRQSIGLTPGGQALELFADLENGTWTILLTLPNGTSCMMASGHDYQAVKQPAGQDV